MASVLGHMTVTRQYITRNLNQESSLTFFVCAAAPSVTRDVRAERAPAVGCRAHADEGARAGRRHVPLVLPGPTERDSYSRPRLTSIRSSKVSPNFRVLRVSETP